MRIYYSKGRLAEKKKNVDGKLILCKSILEQREFASDDWRKRQYDYVKYSYLLDKNSSIADLQFYDKLLEYEKNLDEIIKFTFGEPVRVVGFGEIENNLGKIKK